MPSFREFVEFSVAKWRPM